MTVSVFSNLLLVKKTTATFHIAGRTFAARLFTQSKSIILKYETVCVIWIFLPVLKVEDSWYAAVQLMK